MKVSFKLEGESVSISQIQGDVLFDIEQKISDVSRCIIGFKIYLESIDSVNQSDYKGMCVKTFMLEGMKKQYFVQVNLRNGDEVEVFDVLFQDYTFLKLEDSPLKIVHQPTSQVIELGENANKSQSILKEQELQILHKIMDGLETSEIANALSLSPETVKKYRKEILKKTGCKTFYEVISKYFKNNSF